MQPSKPDPYISLRNPNFRWFSASLVALTLGTQIQAVVVAWQVYELTKDPLYGIITLGVVGVTAWKIPKLRILDRLD